MIETSHLLKVVNAYRTASGLADGTISSYVFNDGQKIKHLRNGKDITVGRFNYALRWFSAHWPEGAAWPDGIARPEAGDGLPVGGEQAGQGKKGIE